MPSSAILWMERRICQDDNWHNKAHVRNECDGARTENATQTRQGWLETVLGIWKEDCCENNTRSREVMEL